MKAVIQRVSSAQVEVAGETVGAIETGLLVLLGVQPEDASPEVAWMVDKILGLRIFADEQQPERKNMNRSVMDIGGSVLVVSQFTLAADTSRGRRPSFGSAAAPEQANAIYQQTVEQLQKKIPTQTGVFGADMQVSLTNDGPVTFILESPIA